MGLGDPRWREWRRALEVLRRTLFLRWLEATTVRPRLGRPQDWGSFYGKFNPRNLVNLMQYNLPVEGEGATIDPSGSKKRWWR